MLLSIPSIHYHPPVPCIFFLCKNHIACTFFPKYLCRSNICCTFAPEIETQMNKSLKISKYVMISSWVFVAIGVVLAVMLFTGLFLQELNPDPVWHDISEEKTSAWEFICSAWTLLALYIVSPIAVISTIVYIILRRKETKP